MSLDLKESENLLWQEADNLRVNSSVSSFEYSTPHVEADFSLLRLTLSFTSVKGLIEGKAEKRNQGIVLPA